MYIIQFIKLSCRRLLLLALPCLLLALAGCFSKVDMGGYVNDVDIKDEIVPGKTTKEEVQDIMGSPSTISSFGNEVWYYISNRMETVAFLKPEVTQQKVVRIAFNDSGIVTDVHQLSEKDAMEFSTVKRETPTEGHSMSIVEQLIGNVGRFNSPDGGGLNRNRPGSVPGGPPGY